MPSAMECEVLFNPAHIGNLFQVGIQLLVADYR